MKLFKSLLLTAMFAVGSVFSVNAADKKPVKQQMSYEISKLLKKHELSLESKEVTVRVTFTLNEDNEIVVLSVDTKNDAISDFIKHRLNYKKISVKGDYPEYNINVRLTT